MCIRDRFEARRPRVDLLGRISITRLRTPGVHLRRPPEREHCRPRLERIRRTPFDLRRSHARDNGVVTTVELAMGEMCIRDRHS